MPPEPDNLAALSNDLRIQIEAILFEFDTSWSPEALPDVAKSISPNLAPARTSILEELVKIDIERRWKSGTGRELEEYLVEFPELGTRETVSAALIQTEYESRKRSAAPVSIKEIHTRFPGQFDEVKFLMRQAAQSNSSDGQAVASLDTSRSSGDESVAEKQPQPASAIPIEFGRYRILRLLGKGAMGAVSLAHDTTLDREVAIKTPTFSGDAAPELIDRFVREARTAATLRHPNICPVYDVGEIDGRYFISMAYIEGRPLSALIGGEKSSSERQVAFVIRKLALALDHAHSNGVVHRDLKPANIMIDAQREPIVMDFGLALSTNEPGNARVTQSGTMLGTPAYMSPEQVDADPERIAAPTDIYSLGVIFYELLTGKLPYNGSVAAILGQIMTQDPAKLSVHRPDLDSELEAICLKMMARRTEDRYASMKDVAAALTEYLKRKPEQRSRRSKDSDQGESELFESKVVSVKPVSQRISDSDNGQSQIEAVAAQSSGWRSSRVRLVALLAIVVVASIVLIVRRPGGGTLKIEVDDPNIKVTLDGDQIELTDKTWEGTKKADKHRLSVRIGEQSLKIGSPTVVAFKDGGTVTHLLSLKLNGVELTSDSFEIRRGETAVVRISYSKIRRADNLDSRPKCVAISPDGTRFLTGEEDGSVILRGTADFKVIKRFTGHQGAVIDAAKSIPLNRADVKKSILEELVKIDIERRWNAGDGRELEAYLQEFPDLGTRETVSAALVQTEYEVRKRSAAPVSAKEIRARFPDQFEEVKRLVRESAKSKSHDGKALASLDTSRSGAADESVAEFQPPNSASAVPQEFGRYRILRVLGQGAMGAVSLAHDTQLDREVAIKTPKFDGDAAPELIERFLREAKSSAMLRHPNICPVHDVGEINGQYFISMAFIEGRPLSAYIGGDKPRPERQVAIVIRKLAQALEHAHDNGVVHRDLKPANIMIDQQREPIVMDFGLAFRTDRPEEARVTQSGTMLGTPAYMSPEQVDADMERIAAATDIYSLGVIFYEFLTGQLPFNGSVAAILGQIMTQEPPKPSEHRTDLDPALEAICLKMMAKTIEERYASMKEVAAALTDYLRGTADSGERQRENSDTEESQKTFRSEGGLQALFEATDASQPSILQQRGLRKDSSKSSGPALVDRWKALSTKSKVALGLVGVLLAASIVLIFRPAGGGTLRIVVDDPDIEVLVDGKTIQLTDKKWEGKQDAKEHRLSVKVGDQHLSIGSPTVVKLDDGSTVTHTLSLKLNGAKLTSDAFEIVRGEKTVVKIDYRKSTTPAPAAVIPKAVAGKKQSVPDVATAPVTKAGEIVERRIDLGATIHAMALSPDGKHIAVGSEELLSEFRIYDLNDPETFRKFGHGGIKYLGYSGDGERIVSASGQKVQVWKVDDPQKPIATLTGFTNEIFGMVVDPGGQWCAVLTQDPGARNREKRAGKTSPRTPVKFFDLSTGKLLAEQTVAPFARRLNMSPDGSLLETNGPQGTKSVVYKVQNGKAITLGSERVLRHKAAHNATSLVFSRNNRFGVAPCTPNSVCRVGLWEIDSAQRIQAVEPNPAITKRGTGRCVGFAHDDAWILAGNEKGELKIWDRKTLKLIVTLTSPDGRPVNGHLAVDQKDRFAVTAGGATIRVWRLPRQQVDLIRSLHKDHIQLQTINNRRSLLVKPLKNKSDEPKLAIPHDPAEEYNLRLRLKRISGNGGLYVRLPVGHSTKKCMLILDDAKGSGIQFINDKRFYENETSLKQPVFTADRAHDVLCRVRRSGVAVLVDGQVRIDWKGPFDALGPAADGERQFGLASPNAEIQILEMAVTPNASSENRTVVATAVPKIGRSIDLLSRLPKEDKRLYVENGERGLHVKGEEEHKIFIDYDPPEEYDCKVTLRREDYAQSRPNYGLAVRLPVGKSFGKCAVLLDGKDGGCGIGQIDGVKGYSENETFSTHRNLLAIGRDHQIEFRVRKHGIIVLVDGKTIIDWNGPLSRLSPAEDAKRWFVFAPFRSHFKIKKAVVVPYDGPQIASQREAAVALMRRANAKIGIDVNGEFQFFTSAEQLPAGAVSVVRVAIKKQTTLRDEDLMLLSHLPDLRQLLLSKNTRCLKDEQLRLINGLKSLEYLSLGRNLIGNAGMTHVSQLRQLTSLSLYSTRIDDDGLKRLAGMTNLQWLSLYRTAITDDGLKHLKGMRSLGTLYLANTNITGRDLSVLTGMKTLHRLSLGGGTFDPKSADLASLKKLPNLKRLWAGTGPDVVQRGAFNLGAVRHWNAFYRELTTKYGFAKKVALVGLSRGGLYCYNWAAANPEKVACIYGDAPVCDFKSWPGGKGKGKGSRRDWQLVLKTYGFPEEAAALAYRKNPIDNLTPLAKAGVPLLHVYGDADNVVPWDENTGIIAKRYRKLGGAISLIAKPGVGHHPHGLDDPAPIVNFIARNSGVAKTRSARSRPRGPVRQLAAKLEPTRSVVYKKVSGRELYMHVFEPADWKRGDRRPCFLTIHGGGWTGGEARRMYPFAAHFARLGYVGISLQYRLRNPKRNTTVFDCVRDGRSAVRFVRAHANELGIDPAKVIVSGASAGGHVAVGTALFTGVDDKHDSTDISCVPNALVLMYPVIDTSPAGYGNGKIGKRWRELSPVHQVKGKVPPTLIFHGTADTVTPFAGATAFRDAMRRAGNRCELIAHNGGKHGYLIFDEKLYRATLKRIETRQVLAMLKKCARKIRFWNLKPGLDARRENLRTRTHTSAEVLEDRTLLSAFSISDVTAVETDSGTTNFVFTVSRDDNTNAETVDYQTADGTAAAGSDFTGIGVTTLNFGAGGDLSKLVTVVVSGDQTVEADETFFVNLSNATNGATIADNQGQGTITNDDTATLSIGNVTQVETNSGTTNFVFTARTPNIDRLARSGVLFTNAHCAAPACNPSRTAIFTGLAPHRSGVYANGQKMRTLLPDAELLPKYFQRHGYWSGGSGKMLHYFIDAASWDEYFPKKENENPFPRHISWGKRPKNLPRAGKWQYSETDWAPFDVSDEKFGGDYHVASWVIKQLKRQHDKPFFLACGIYRPHEPWFVPKKYFDLFPLDKVQMPPGLKEDDLDDLPPAGKRRGPNRYLAHIRKHGQWKNGVQAYLASIAFADAMLGRVMDALEKSPHRNNTIVVLWSDHGWHLGEKQHWQKYTGWRVCTRARDYALTGGGAGMIVRHGKVVMAWGDTGRRYDLKSTTKSIGMTAVGLAIKDGKLKLSDRAQPHHPQFGIPPESNRKTGWLKEITLLHLATQTAGFEKPGGYRRLTFRPGTKWSYSDGGPNWLAECVTLAYRQDVSALMFTRVFQPIGITKQDLFWRQNAYRPAKIEGIDRREFGSGVHANVNAMARIGYLYLRKGKWRRQTILPAAFVARVGRPVKAVVGLPEVDSRNYGNASDHYGLLWWNNADGTLKDVPRDAYWSWGLYESLIVVIPSLDIVAARAGKSWKRQWSGHYDVLEPFLGAIARSATSRKQASDRKRKMSEPYPSSPVIRGIRWAPPSQVIRLARGSDNWPATWASDDRLYTAYGDGRGFRPYVERKLSLGLGRVSGSPPKIAGENMRSKTAEKIGDGKRGMKASGMLSIEGRLYMWARNAQNSQLAWSTDRGKTWTWADWKFTKSFGAPTFLNFGRDYAGARDDYVYIYSHDSNSAYQPADRMVLARVPKSKLRQRAAYEFFQKSGTNGQPVWARNIKQRGGVFHHAGVCYRSGITYNAGLKRYLWCQTHPKGDARFAGGFAIYDAPEPWGPWTTVFSTRKWDIGPGETSSFPTKWMSRDGRTLHLLFSGNDCFSVRKAELTIAGPANK
eukprot:g22041.t1